MQEYSSKSKSIFSNLLVGGINFRIPLLFICLLALAGTAFANTHTSTAAINPNIVKTSTFYNFTASVTNVVGPDSVSEFRIYLTASPNDMNDISCQPASGWYGPFIIPGALGFFCQYTAQTTGDYIAPGNSKDFTFTATSPATGSCRTLNLETRDPNQYYTSLPTQVCVDATPPETTKTYGNPFFTDGNYDYITKSTPVTLTAIDPQPHPSGVKNIKYRDFLAPSTICYKACNPESYDQYGVEVPWITVDGNTVTFYKEQQSCHVIEFYSEDNVDNVENLNYQCVFVDNKPPVLTKTVGDPKLVGSQGLIDYYITQNTPINLSCVDQQPHPSDNVTIYWTYTVDGNQGSEGSQHGQDYNLYFKEDSMHVLKAWCVDALGNESKHDTETFKVDTAPPVIVKSMLGIEGQDYLGDCPPKGVDENCFVADNGNGGINVSASDGEDIHAVGRVSCDYTVEWNGQIIDSGSFRSDQNIFFKNDSTHIVTVTCSDALGNPAQDIEAFLVDSTPPVTLKTYGDPHYPANINDPAPYPHWISTDTNITLIARDEKVGVDKIFWRNILVPESNCLSESECLNYEGDGQLPEWTEYTGPFKKPEESCHLLEFYSVDLLGNTPEEVNRQCVFVDNTAPDLNKTIGDPKVVLCKDNDGGVNDTNSPGDLLADITMPSVSAFTNVGVAFDGTVLYVPDSTTIIQLIDPLTGSQVGTLPTSPAVNFGAMAYDGKRNVLWACSNNSPHYLYRVDLNGDAVLITTSLPGSQYYYCDGLAYDENDPDIDSDDRIWYSPDVSSTVYILDLTGIQVDSFVPSLGGCGNSGIAVGGDDLYLANNGCDEIYRFDKLTKLSLGLFSAPGDRPEDLECDDKTFQGKSAVWVRMYENNHLKAYEIEAGTCGIGGQPPEPPGCEEEEVYITQDTPINLSCEDKLPHPVDNVSIKYRFRFSNDCQNLADANWSEWFDPVGIVLDKVIYFSEDSCHELEYYCEDALGNVSQVFSEIDIVDTLGPVITKEVVGPQKGQCPPNQDSNETCIIDGATEIHVNAVDPEPHPVDDVKCDWFYQVLDDDGASGGQQGVTPPFVINFPEESEHLLAIVCRDALGNETRDVETFFVDKTPPVTTKEYGDPFFDVETGEWITSQTPITLTVEDAGPHKSGIKKTNYRVSLLADNSECDKTSENYCTAEGSGDWNNYAGQFSILEESCHLIEFYSVDNVEKDENVNRQCVYVDNSAPTPVKTVGKPSSQWDGNDSIFYPEIGDGYFEPGVNEECWQGEDPLECWKVTKLTPITLDCNDPQPHPVDNEVVCYKVELDGDDATQQYCGDGGLNEDGYCCTQQAPVEFFFGEETEHNLDFYCTDALGNGGFDGVHDDEKFKVEGTAFTINLNKKWNLVSVPFVLKDSDPDAVFDDIAGNVQSVWAFDAFTDQWYVFTPDGDSSNDSISEISPGWGYWLAAYNPDVLVLGGSLFSPMVTPPSRNLKTGWNLIGYYGIKDQQENAILTYDGPNLFGDGRKAKCALNSLGSSLLDKGWTALVTEWDSVEMDLGKNHFMNPGAGYWISLPADGLYNYSTTCGLVQNQ